MKISDFLSWLDSFLNFEKKQTKGIFWLESMKFLCEKLGNPQNKVKCIHVAGSKGKGSVSTMIANMIEKQGFSCGLYTSPHISDFRERITSAHGFLNERIYEEAAEVLYKTVSSIKLEDFPGGRSLTWFELVTAFAFLCFQIAKMDYAVYETGLGGRLDSTNIVNPLVSVLTSIELEHTEFLGDTIPLIAEEKAGIIKEKTSCVIGHQRNEEAMAVFKSKAKSLDSKAIVVDENICNESFSFIHDKNDENFGKMTIHFSIGNKKECLTEIDAKLKLLGKVQLENAETAVIAVKTAIPSISIRAIQEGLSVSFLHGRFEINEISISGKKTFVIFDGAHTKNSIEGTLSTLESYFPDEKKVLLFACAKDKKYHEFIPLFANRFEKVTVTKPGYVRASDVEEICAVFQKEKIEIEREEDCSKAFIKSFEKAVSSNAVLLVTGSFYLVAEIKKALKEFKAL